MRNLTARLEVLSESLAAKIEVSILRSEVVVRLVSTYSREEENQLTTSGRFG